MADARRREVGIGGNLARNSNSEKFNYNTLVYIHVIGGTILSHVHISEPSGSVIIMSGMSTVSSRVEERGRKGMQCIWREWGPREKEKARAE